MVTIIITAHTQHVPDTSIEVSKDEAAKLLRTLPITHLSVIEAPHKRWLIADYDSILVGSRVTFMENI